MTASIRRLGIILVAVLVVASGGALAAPSVDSETTNTASTSALNDGDTVTTFNASDSEQLPTLEASYDSDNPGIEIVDPDTGDVIKEVTNSSNPDYFTVTDATNNHYNTTFNESDFAAVPMGASENKSVTLRLIGNTSKDDPATTNVTVYLENTDERAVVYAGSSAVAGDSGTTTDADAENASSFFGLLGEHEQASVEHDSLAVAGDNTTVYVLYAAPNVSDAYDAAADRGGLFGSLGEGDLMPHQVRLEENPVLVFNSEVPDDVADGITTAETTTVDGYNAVAVDLDEDYEDETSLDVSARANDKYSIWTKLQLRNEAFGAFGALGLMLAASGAPVLAGLPLVFTRREDDEQEV